MLKKLKQNFCFKFDLQVWRMKVDGIDPLLALELRDHNLKKLEFAIIDFAAGKINSEGVNLPIDWWAGISETSDGMLVIHKYAGNNNPQQKGFIIYNLRENKVVYENDSDGYLGLLNQHILAIGFGFDKIGYKSIDLVSGKQTQVDEKEVLEIISEKEKTKKNKIILPQHYPESNEYFKDIAAFLKQSIGVEAKKGADYMETGNWIVVSYYTLATDLLDNYLLVTDKQGDIYTNICISKEIQGIGLETFFILNDQLIFIKDKNEVISYELP